jgi:hypothetical protein
MFLVGMGDTVGRGGVFRALNLRWLVLLTRQRGLVAERMRWIDRG